MRGVGIALLTGMGAIFLSLAPGVEATNISGVLGSLIWMMVIAIVMICLIVVGIVGLVAGTKTKT